MLPEYYEVVHYKIVQDETKTVTEKLVQWSPQCDLILTTGGTGLAPRDITPEATMEVVDRLVPGLSEACRAAGAKVYPRALLSRAVAGIRENTLIVNLPGSPEAVRAGLEAILPALDIALEVLRERLKEAVSARELP